MKFNDLVAGLVLILAAGAMIAYTTTFPAFPGQRYGPSLFPRILGVLIIACGLVLVWRGVAARRAGAMLVEIAAWVRQPRQAGAFVLVLASILFYILLAERIGFVPVATVFLLSLLLWLGVTAWKAGLIAVVATLTIYWFFAYQLRVPLPRGLLVNVF
jgi:putative tricarboxylic transport membrane protein